MIATIGDGARERGKHLAHHLQQRRRHIAILDVARCDNEANHQAKRVDTEVTLLAFDFLARIVAGSIDPRPPFSALLTLWLSTIAVVATKSTVHDYFVEWHCDGTLTRIHHALYAEVRKLAGKEPMGGG